MAKTTNSAANFDFDIEGDETEEKDDDRTFRRRLNRQEQNMPQRSSPTAIDRMNCVVCGRGFARDRIAIHQKICRQNKANKKKREKFDSTQQQRYDGNDIANMGGSSNHGTTVRQWKQQSNALRMAARNAKIKELRRKDADNQQFQLQNKVNQLHNEVEMIRMKTLFEMVNELNVVTGGKVNRQNIVWLKNKQAHMFQPSTMKKLFTLLQIKNPPPLVIFIRDGKFSQAEITNGGIKHLTRTKLIPIRNISFYPEHDSKSNKFTHNKQKFNESNVDQYIKPGDEVFVHTKASTSDRPTSGYAAQLLRFDGPNCIVRSRFCCKDGMPIEKSEGDHPILTSIEMFQKLVAESGDDRAELSRCTSIFVSDVLMPIIIKTGALVVTAGTNECSLCVALGDAFARLSSQRGGLHKNNIHADAANADSGNSSSHSTAGVGNPRLIGIVQYPIVAGAALRIGSNTHALVLANDKTKKNRKNSFVTKQYNEFLDNINGKQRQTYERGHPCFVELIDEDDKEFEYWPQYDLVDGLTDVVFIDQKDAATGKCENSAYRHFFDLLASIFSNEVPSLSIQFGCTDVPGLVDLVSAGSDLLVLDSRKRELKKNSCCTLSEVLDNLTTMHRNMWEKGSAELHISSTLSFLHRSLCERSIFKNQKGKRNDAGTGSHDRSRTLTTIATAIQQYGNNSKTDAVDAVDAAGAVDKDGDDGEEMTFEMFINEAVDIIRANYYVVKVLRRLYNDDRSDQIFDVLKNFKKHGIELSGQVTRNFINEYFDPCEIVGAYLKDENIQVSLTELYASSMRFELLSQLAKQKKIEYEKCLHEEILPGYTKEKLNKYFVSSEKTYQTNLFIEQRTMHKIIHDEENMDWAIIELEGRFKLYDKYVLHNGCTSPATLTEYLSIQGSKIGYAGLAGAMELFREEYVLSSPELLECLNMPIKEMARKPEINQTNRKYSGTGLHLQLFTLLKPAWEKGSYTGSDLFSGSLFDLDDLSRTLEERLSVIDRLPSSNTLEELHAIRDAWNDFDRYTRIGKSTKFAAKYSYIILLLLGIATVVVSSLVGAGQLDNVSSASSSSSFVAANGSSTATRVGMESTGDYIAFCLALISSFCASYIAYVSPVQRWQQLKNASLILQSEIIQFRTRTGDYDYSVQKQNALVLREAVTSLREQTLSRSGISSTTFFKKYSKHTFKHGQYNSRLSSTNNTIDSKRISNSRPGKSSVTIVPSFIASPESHVKPIIDDFHSPMDANAFIALRLEPTIQFYQSRVQPYYMSKTAAAIFLMLATGASAAMASLGMTVWIGIISICASSVTSWVEFSGVAKKLARYSDCITKLRDIRLWWETLSTVKKSSSNSIRQLICMTEDVINSEIKAWLATSMAAKSLNKAAAAAKGEKESKTRSSEDVV